MKTKKTKCCNKQPIEYNKVFFRLGLWLLLGIGLITAVRVIDGDNHRLGQIEFKAN